MPTDVTHLVDEGLVAEDREQGANKVVVSRSIVVFGVRDGNPEHIKMAGSVEGTVSRLVRIGFEVRLTVRTVDGEEVSVVLTRTHARCHGLGQGSTVWLTPAA